MKYEDLDFTITQNDKTIDCSIVSLVPKDDRESYVAFTDYTTDGEGNVIIQYGRLIEDNGEYELRAGVDEEELEKIKREMKDDIMKLSHDIIENN